MDFDYIIVGGGSAGCVMAHRLSARSNNRVLLCEAGQDTLPGKVPEAILSSYSGLAYLNKEFTWSDLRVSSDWLSDNDPAANRRPTRPYEQARIMGGGSSINGQMANRGLPSDYDEWAERGAQGWAWKDVLPFFRKLERDMDFEGPLHGDSGRIPIRRIFPDLWPDHATQVAAALQKSGMKYIPDQNAEFGEGYSPIAISNAYERRVSSAIAYLDSTTRMRSNLTISARTIVNELLFDGLKCIGVRASVEGKPQEFRGREIIVCSGALHSPAHLLRAGIGPAGELRDLGIEVVKNLSGVGRGLMDHPTIALASYIRPHARLNSHSSRHVYVSWRYSSKLPDTAPCDMFVVNATKTSWHDVGKQIGTFILLVYKTYSDQGRVQLKSSDWRDSPRVDFNLLSDRRDLDRLADGFRRLAQLHDTPEMQSVTELPFPAIYGEKVRQVGQMNLKNRILTATAAKMIDASSAVRRFMFENFITDGLTTRDLLNDQDALEGFIRKAAIGAWHPSCSCKMGSESDPMAVTDSGGRVHGIQGLRVVDASIFPAVPCANLNVPVMMTAEKISDHILRAA